MGFFGGFVQKCAFLGFGKLAPLVGSKLAIPSPLFIHLSRGRDLVQFGISAKPVTANLGYKITKTHFGKKVPFFSF